MNIQKRYGLCRLHCSFTPKEPIFSTHPYLYISIYTAYPKNEINTPAATAEPITPEIFLGKQIEYLHKKNTTGNRQGKCQETANHDADGCPVEECFGSHSSAHRKSQKNGGGIHDAV